MFSLDGCDSTGESQEERRSGTHVGAQHVTQSLNIVY